MQIHKPANSDQTQKMAQPKSDKQSFQFAIDSAPSFVDARTQAAQLASIQSTTSQGPQQQKLLTLQAKVASAYSAPSFFQESQSGLKSSQILNNSASAVPVQRLANKHGMTPAKLKKAAGYSVYGWGRLIANDGSFVDLTPSKAENGQHAEDYLMEEASAILALNPDGYSDLQIWVTSSPCSTTFGTSEKDEGCHEELNEIPEQYPISLDVFATKAYQPKGVIGGKKASVDAMTSDSNINYAVDNKRGVANTLNLQKYTVPADLAPLGNTVIQLADQASNDSKVEIVRSNNTGLPDNLKSGIENLSGYSMDDVKVHYNSDKPAQLNAHAYAQGTNIHVAPGQEQHLPHEAWHVVQQKQGRVQPTLQMKAGVPVNDDAGLEHEADVMGSKANLLTPNSVQRVAHKVIPALQNYQLKRVYQLAPTTIDYGNLQEFKFNGATGNVGSSMSAHLNPADPKVGSDTVGSNAYPSLFKELQSSTATSWVRGHLLNHDLGGVAHYNNLFPITVGANNEHKYEVEYPVKHWLNEGCEIDYTVTAKKINAGDTDADGVFECNAQVTAGEKYRGERIQKNIYSKTKKVTSERHFRNKEKESVEGFSQVDRGPHNGILRDDYEAPSASDGWNHSKGNSGNNYFIHNGVRLPGELADGTTKLSLLIKDLQVQLKNLPLDHYSSAYESAVKQAKESMSNLRSLWNGVGLDIKKIIAADILHLVDNYLMNIQGRRPSQTVMLQEMGFTF